jgi:DNA-3-methyladenine glycosylase I
VGAWNSADFGVNFRPCGGLGLQSAQTRPPAAGSGIIRNRLKIAPAVGNAKALLKVQAEFGSFDAYIWRFVDGKPLVNAWEAMKQVPAHTEQSDAMSKDLRKRGFNFIGTTICYAFMQAVEIGRAHV